MPLDDLFAEAERQLNVCNSCRYCEGYCPVWPELELRTNLLEGDITHLANLCHDCRDCFSACMYTAPHEFDLNPPKIFAQIREVTYRRYVWPTDAPAWIRGRRGTVLSFLAAIVIFVALAVAVGNGSVFSDPGSGAAYELVPHLLLVVLMTAPVFWSVAILSRAAVLYWRDTHGALRDLGHLRVWAASFVQGAQLRHMRGGGAGCDYVETQPSQLRRRLHIMVSYGFGLCLISTTSAAVMQEFLGREPPYGYLSAPVVTGTAGGLGMVVGCAGLAVIKRRSDPDLTTVTMRRADYGLLWALLVLALTGLATLLLRHSVAFGSVLVVHLAAVIVAFAITPYTKFVHFIYRLLAIYKSNLATVRS